MNSFCADVNRKFIRRTVKEHEILGVNLQECAGEILKVHGLHSVYRRKTFEILLCLVDEGMMQLRNSELVICTREERQRIRANKENHEQKIRRLKRRSVMSTHQPAL